MSVCRHCNTTVDTAELRCCVVTKEKFCPVCYEQHLAGCGGCREAAFVPPLWREPVVRPKGHGKTVLLQGVPVLLGANLAPAAAWPPHAPTPPRRPIWRNPKPCGWNCGAGSGMPGRSPR